jgi:hypothetical protein
MKRYKRLALDDTRARIEHYDVKSSAAAHGVGSQVTSQSLGLPLDHMNLPQQPQYSGISAHNFNPQAKLEQLNLSKTDSSTWL